MRRTGVRPRRHYTCDPVHVHTHTHNLVLYLAHEHTRGLEGQPPVQYEHEVVTGDGDVDTLLQATL